jgi:pyridoxamine 5'-phosphate oxidase
MELNEILKFVTDNPICFFATLDGDQPKVRALQLFSADKTGLYYSIDASKDVYKQLKVNPKVEVCFLDPKSKIGDMVRVTGKVEFVQDMAMKRKVIEERPFLKQMGITAESPGLLIMKVAKCQANHWSRANMMEPKKYVNFG